MASREFYAGLLFGAVRADVEFDTTYKSTFFLKKRFTNDCFKIRWVNMKAPPKVYSKKVYDKVFFSKKKNINMYFIFFFF